MLAFYQRARQPLFRALAIAAIALAPAVLHAALPTHPDISGRTSTGGELLIAAPQLRDPFDHAVILMAQHSREGALGIVINHPLASRPVADLIRTLGGNAAGVAGDIRVFRGGPVGGNVGFVVHSAEYRRDGTLDLDGRVALTDAADALRDVALGQGPKKSLVALGYAGWAPQQLDDEIARGAWLTMPEDPALVFDDDRAKVWNDALALLKNGR